MIGRTYSIIRSRREQYKTINTVLATGMSWGDADKQRDEIAAQYRRDNPLKTSWSGDIFLVQLEPIPGPQQELFECLKS